MVESQKTLNRPYYSADTNDDLTLCISLSILNEIDFDLSGFKRFTISFNHNLVKNDFDCIICTVQTVPLTCYLFTFHLKVLMFSNVNMLTMISTL